MPVLYKPFQSTLEDKKSGKKLFYPRVVRSGNVDSAQLSKEIAAYSSLSPGDVKKHTRQPGDGDGSTLAIFGKRKRGRSWYLPYGDGGSWQRCGNL